MRHHRLIAFAAAIGLASPLASAGFRDNNITSVEPLYLQTQPATAPTEVKRVVIEEVRGSVEVSTDGEKTWKMATGRMVVDEGATFRTGLRSRVFLTIDPGQELIIESLSTVTVLQARQQGNQIKTDVIMKHGATQFNIEAAGREYDAQIRTPSSTMAIRGTNTRITDRAPFAPTVESYEGQIAYRSAQRQARLGGARYAAMKAGDPNAAQTALNQTVVDPSLARARTPSESEYIADQSSRGAVLGFDNRVGIPVIRNGPGPTSDEELAASLPGRLNFALRWTGNADLNFLVDNQAGDQEDIIFSGFRPTEILFPGFGLNTSLSGGKIPFDDRGGPRGGQEIAFWDSPPVGVYGVGALHAGGGAADFKINAFLDGTPLNFITFDANFNLVKTTQLEGTLTGSALDDAAAILFVPSNPGFEDPLPDISPQTTQQIQAMARKLVASGQMVPQLMTPQPAVKKVNDLPKVTMPKHDALRKNLGVSKPQKVGKGR